MIIQCEKCQTKFNLDESLLKTEGSKVRCSSCKEVFFAYPPNKAEIEEAQTIAVSSEQLEGSLINDSSKVSEEGTESTSEKAEDIDFDNVFEDSLEHFEEGEGIETGEDLQELIEEEDPERNRKPKDAQGEEPGIPAAAPSRDSKGKRHFFSPSVWLILLMFFLLVLGAGAAIFFWAPSLIPDSLSILKPANKQEITDIGVRRLSFKAVTGSFIDSERAGSLFLIQGMVSNKYPKSRSFILVKGTILDDKGQVVKTQLAYAGNELKEEDIKKMPMDAIQKAMKNRYGINKQNLNVAPGKSVPFTIVFDQLPDNLGEFTVEAVSSSLGTQ